jgi:hypothetical protein
MNDKFSVNAAIVYVSNSFAQSGLICREIGTVFNWSLPDFAG